MTLSPTPDPVGRRQVWIAIAGLAATIVIGLILVWAVVATNSSTPDKTAQRYEQAYLLQLREDLTDFHGTDAELLTLGRYACELMADGSTRYDTSFELVYAVSGDPAVEGALRVVDASKIPRLAQMYLCRDVVTTEY
ncbi:hypothetical protein SEA_SKOG_100 [Gordonia phage Skog]|uniref:DUF732 domain-containing protein n=1 Tax=Gordonia phage Skog TaxID=2704033 RepID=A0A6G6XJH6_9CAUD|nr:hypothetical protein KHQ85_gp100 [Gordonia phage Skog]QIG58252.1 hypothetical protein SEA_SKOG_100 [Gordonia phage Skog]